MTLLVVTVEIPVGIPMDRFSARLQEVVPEVLSFFISFAVIGRYWMAHHQFFGLLKAIIDDPDGFMGPGEARRRRRLLVRTSGAPSAGRQHLNQHLGETLFVGSQDDLRVRGLIGEAH